MSETLYLTPHTRDLLFTWAEVARPNETCGLIAATKEMPYLGYRIRPIQNIHPKPTRFYRMDPDQQVRATHAIDARGDIILAVHHSHVDGPALLSDTDLNEAMDLEPLYVITSLRDREIKAYRISMPFIGVKAFDRVPVEVIDPGAAGG